MISIIVAFVAPVNAAHAGQFGVSAVYSHLHPKHIALACRECHSLKANETDIHEMPGHATCSACHNFAKEAMDRTEAFCGECHTSTDATKEHPALYEFPRRHAAHDFGDRFSHVAHKNAGTATRCDLPGAAAASKCADCHRSIQPIAPALRPDKKMEASHAFCFACHCDSPRGYSEGTKDTNPARNDCAVCHAAHEPALVRFADIRDFRHADHIFDTRPRRKGPVSHDPDLLCIECHGTAAESRHLGDIRQPSAPVCTTCHTGKPGLPDTLSSDVLKPFEASQ